MSLPDGSQERKDLPITSGVLDYFPNAIVAVAAVSKFGNDKHNPGEPLHWSREKSNDHADCVVRHVMDRGGVDGNGVRHSAQAAWRALAMLEEELIADGATPGRGTSNAAEPEPEVLYTASRSEPIRVRRLGRPPELGESYIIGGGSSIFRGKVTIRRGSDAANYEQDEAVEVLDNA